MKQASLFLKLFIFFFLLAACRSRDGTSLTIPFIELLSNPIKYSGSNICTEGIYLSGFEVSALGADTYTLNGNIYLTEPAIWVEGVEVVNLNECKVYQGYSFCSVKICGRFEYGNQYGHMGGYEYQIISSQIN
jgi:hypothetical protein